MGAHYAAPIDRPADFFQHFYPADEEEFYAQAAVDRARLGDVQLYANLMNTNRTDYWGPDGSIKKGHGRLSVHMDAVKFAGWLQDAASEYPNLKHVDDVMESFEQDPQTGFVKLI